MTTGRFTAMDGAGMLVGTIGAGMLAGTIGAGTIGDSAYGSLTIIIHGTTHGTTHGIILIVSTAVITIMATLITDTIVTEDGLTRTLMEEGRGIETSEA